MRQPVMLDKRGYQPTEEPGTPPSKPMPASEPDYVTRSPTLRSVHSSPIPPPGHPEIICRTPGCSGAMYRPLPEDPLLAEPGRNYSGLDMAKELGWLLLVVSPLLAILIIVGLLL